MPRAVPVQISLTIDVLDALDNLLTEDPGAGDSRSHAVRRAITRYVRWRRKKMVTPEDE